MTPDIAQHDGIAGLRELDAGSVDLVLSDLPSGETEAEFDHAPDLAALFSATWHALKPDGVAVFMASSLRFAAACMTAGGKAYRYDLIWEKSIATGFLNAKKKPLRIHEFVLVFSRERGCYAPQKTTGHSPTAVGPGAKRKRSENYNDIGDYDVKTGVTDRYPQSILKVGSVPNCPGGGRIHPQQKPVDLLRWLVRSYSRPGDLVVDPFSGSGSTGVAALTEGRDFFGFDTSPRFAPRGVCA